MGTISVSPPIWAPRNALLAILVTSSLPGAYAKDAAPSPAPPSPAPAAAKPADDSVKIIADQLDRSPGTLVATVNGTPITLGMVSDRLREFPPNMKTIPGNELYALAVRDLISQRAAVLKARELGLDKDPVIQRRIGAASDRELINALLAREAPGLITPEQISERYKTEFDNQPGPDEVQLRVIITPTQEEAEKALRLIQDGMDFADAAREYSHDTSKATGGNVGFVQRNQLAAETGAVAFSLAPGQITAYPVSSGGLWFILKCEARRHQNLPTLAEATPRLRQELFQQAAIEVLKNARAGVEVKEFGATGQAPPATK